MTETLKVEEKIDIIQILQLLWVKKWRIIAFGLTFSLLAAAYSMIQKPVYKAESKIFCKTGSNKNGNLTDLAQLAGINLANTNNTDPSAFFDVIVQDGDFLRKILEKRWHYNGDSLLFEQIWEMEPDTSRVGWREIFWEDKIVTLRKSIKLIRDTKKNLITITTSFPDPLLTRDINIHVIKMLDQYLIETLKSHAKEARKFIESRISEVDHELMNSENKIAHYRQTNKDVYSPYALLEQKRLERKMMLNQEVYFQLRKQHELAKIEEYKDQPLIEVISAPKVPVRRFSPQRKRITIAGFMVGIFTGISFILTSSIFIYIKDKVKQDI